MLGKKAFYKSFCFLLILISFCSYFCGCIKSPSKSSDTIPLLDKLSVHFLDVSNGDCIFINLPDGKRALIDCGSKSSSNLEKITKALKTYSVNKIDYFILTHPHENHVGNALELLKQYKIGTLFISMMPSSCLSLFPEFNKIITYAKQHNIPTEISKMGLNLGNDAYNFTFLYPEPFEFIDSAYSKLYSTNPPTTEKVDNVSAVLYLEYMGVRFLFTGDIGESAEKKILEFDFNGFYSNFEINLKNIDFLKVSSHGTDSASSEKFLKRISTKHAYVFINQFNPNLSDDVLYRLKYANTNCKVLRSDFHKWASVHVKAENSFTISTFN